MTRRREDRVSAEIARRWGWREPPRAWRPADEPPLMLEEPDEGDAEKALQLMGVLGGRGQPSRCNAGEFAIEPKPPKPPPKRESEVEREHRMIHERRVDRAAGFAQRHAEESKQTARDVLRALLREANRAWDLTRSDEEAKRLELEIVAIREALSRV